MEKDVAVREWCLERAICARGGTWNDEDIIRTAIKYEHYVNNGKCPSPSLEVKDGDGNVLLSVP